MTQQTQASPGTFHQHVFPVLDALIEAALAEVRTEKMEISCRKGCNHCCYLLVEISMEEAYCLAQWLTQQNKSTQKRLLQKIQTNAEEARTLFAKSKRSSAYIGAVDADATIEEACFDEYFYGKPRLCPFNEKGACMAYAARPSSCRLHMVSSDPALCSQDIEDDTDYEIPDRIEQVREEFTPINVAVSKDGRWGQLSILVEIALVEMGILQKG